MQNSVFEFAATEKSAANKNIVDHVVRKIQIRRIENRKVKKSKLWRLSTNSFANAEGTCRDMFADSDSENDHETGNFATSETSSKPIVDIASQTQDSDSEPDRPKFNLAQHEAAHARWKLKMAAMTTEMCAQLQVSDRLEDLKSKHAGRSQSLPPPSKLAEDKYFARTVKIDRFTDSDLRRTRSQGDYTGGKSLRSCLVVTLVVDHCQFCRCRSPMVG